MPGTIMAEGFVNFKLYVKKLAKLHVGDPNLACHSPYFLLSRAWLVFVLFFTSMVCREAYPDELFFTCPAEQDACPRFTKWNIVGYIFAFGSDGGRTMNDHLRRGRRLFCYSTSQGARSFRRKLVSAPSPL